MSRITVTEFKPYMRGKNDIYFDYFVECYDIGMKERETDADDDREVFAYIDKSERGSHWRLCLLNEEDEYRYASYIICDSYEDALFQAIGYVRF